MLILLIIIFITAIGQGEADNMNIHEWKMSTSVHVVYIVLCPVLQWEHMVLILLLEYGLYTPMESQHLYHFTPLVKVQCFLLLIIGNFLEYKQKVILL